MCLSDARTLQNNTIAKIKRSVSVSNARSLLTNTNVLFDKRTKRYIRYIWTALGILIIISMMLFFAPGLIPGAGQGGFGF